MGTQIPVNWCGIIYLYSMFKFVYVAVQIPLISDCLRLRMLQGYVMVIRVWQRSALTQFSTFT